MPRFFEQLILGRIVLSACIDMVLNITIENVNPSSISLYNLKCKIIPNGAKTNFTQILYSVGCSLEL